jgi:hypothetical protein
VRASTIRGAPTLLAVTFHTVEFDDPAAAYRAVSKLSYIAHVLIWDMHVARLGRELGCSSRPIFWWTIRRSPRSSEPKAAIRIGNAQLPSGETVWTRAGRAPLATDGG